MTTWMQARYVARPEQPPRGNAMDRRTHLLSLTCLLGLSACGGDEGRPPHLAWVDLRPLVSEPGLHDVTVEDSRMVVPSAGLPPEVMLGNSRNNLDVVRFEGRVYLAFRTSPNHFAGPDTVMYVVSSADETTWTYETQIALGTDVREPRFVVTGSALLLYFAVLGDNMYAFDPMGTRFIEKLPTGWTAPELLDRGKIIPWRTATRDGTSYMTTYIGGEHIYLFDWQLLDVQFLKSTDGRTWLPVGSLPNIYHGGASETAFAWNDAGDLFFVMRTEGLDFTGVGSKICVARGGDVDDLYCRTDPKKYDSPLLFHHDGEIYLVGRRNLTDTGYYGDPEFDYAYVTPSHMVGLQLPYSNASKRCSLWRFVQDEVRIAWVLDLPSNGDTCFASEITGATPAERIVYDYSSDPDGPILTWHEGQEGVTNIYRHRLRFTRR